MLRKLLATIARRRPDDTTPEHQPVPFSPEAMQFEPMVPLGPPPAQNDDVMQEVYEEVEKALRTNGHRH